MTLNEYNVNFSRRIAAADCLSHMSEIAHDYGSVTVAETINSYVKPIYSLHSKLYWTEDDLEQAKIVTVDDRYTVELPEPRHQTEYKYPTPNTYPSPDVLNITIMVNEIDVYDPDEIISDVFKHISQVKDRMINIAIM